MSRPYYTVLDGLRGLAILLVVIFRHNFSFLDFFSFGWLGVDLFFVISGFLITGILLDCLEKPHYLRNFYLRRLLRISPPYYLLLILCLFILPRIDALQFNTNFYQQNQLFLWTYLQNWLIICKEPGNDHSLLHTWSLAIEEQFYITWPIIVLLLRKPKGILVFTFLLLLFTAIARYVIYQLQLTEFSYSNLFTYTRIDGLCVGATVCLIMRTRPTALKNNRNLIIIILAAIQLSFFILTKNMSIKPPYWALVGYTSLAIAFGLLVFEAAAGTNPLINRLFDNRFMRFFGTISYGLYIYHWPMFLIIHPLLTNWLSNYISLDSSNLLAALTATAAAIAVSVMSYKYFEQPILRLKSKLNE